VVDFENRVFFNFFHGTIQVFVAFWAYAHSEQPHKPLEVTPLVGGTRLAPGFVYRQEQPQGSLLEPSNLIGVGPHHHPCPGSHFAGHEGLPLPFDFHEAHSAGGGWVQHLFQEAEIGDVDAIAEAPFKKASRFIDEDPVPVHNDSEHTAHFPQNPFQGTRFGGETFLTASYSDGHATMHSPHLTHLFWSMAFLRPAVVKMASVGQHPTHASHPRAHRSSSM